MSEVKFECSTRKIVIILCSRVLRVQICVNLFLIRKFRIAQLFSEYLDVLSDVETKNYNLCFVKFVKL